MYCVAMLEYFLWTKEASNADFLSSYCAFPRYHVSTKDLYCFGSKKCQILPRYQQLRDMVGIKSREEIPAETKVVCGAVPWSFPWSFYHPPEYVKSYVRLRCTKQHYPHIHTAKHCNPDAGKICSIHDESSITTDQHCNPDAKICSIHGVSGIDSQREEAKKIFVAYVRNHYIKVPLLPVWRKEHANSTSGEETGGSTEEKMEIDDSPLGMEDEVQLDPPETYFSRKEGAAMHADEENQAAPKHEEQECHKLDVKILAQATKCPQKPQCQCNASTEPSDPPKRVKNEAQLARKEGASLHADEKNQVSKKEAVAPKHKKCKCPPKASAPMQHINRANGHGCYHGDDYHEQDYGVQGGTVAIPTKPGNLPKGWKMRPNLPVRKVHFRMLMKRIKSLKGRWQPNMRHKNVTNLRWSHLHKIPSSPSPNATHQQRQLP